MEVIREILWKRCLSTPTKPPAKNSNICLPKTANQHKGTRKKCKKTNQAAFIQWQRQCLMDKPHRKPWPKSKTSDISKQSPSPLHHTFLLGRARFTAQPLSALMREGPNARDQIPFILSESPNECWLHTYDACLITTWRLRLRATRGARKYSLSCNCLRPVSNVVLLPC